MHNLLVSTTPEANLPQLSMTMMVNFATSTAGVIDTGGILPQVWTTLAVICHLRQWHRLQIMGTILDCLHLKGNICANFRKNLKWPDWDIQGLGGNWFMKKTWRRKSCGTVPLPRKLNTQYFFMGLVVNHVPLYVHAFKKFCNPPSPPPSKREEKTDP